MTALAEAALRSLALRADDHRRLAAAGLVAPRGRHQPADHDARNGNSVTDCVAVAESFAVSRLLALRPAVRERDVFTWEGRRNEWRKHGSVDLRSYEQWLALMGYVEVRNALQHGSGRLTDRQLGDHRREILGWIAAANVHLNGPNVVLTEGDPVACAGVCAGFVRFLDAAAPLA
ncbi:MAG: hypothetical protein ACRDSF_01380 [Pseudonocardiaceae bacterium]